MERLAEVRELENQVRRRMVDVTFTIDPPASESGAWWIDVQRYGRIASIEWRPGKGYGVAVPDGGYGEGMDFVVDDAAAAAEYVARVLQPYTASDHREGPIDTTELREELITALSAHIDHVVGQIVHETIEKLLLELRSQVGDVSADVRRVENELARIAAKVLSERNSGTSGSSDSASDKPSLPKV
jgi:hypothetical protein